MGEWVGERFGSVGSVILKNPSLEQKQRLICEWLGDLVNGWVTGWVNGWVICWMGGCLGGWVGERFDGGSPHLSKYTG